MFKYFVYEWGQIEDEAVTKRGNAAYFTAGEWDLNDVKRRIQNLILGNSTANVDVFSVEQVSIKEYVSFLQQTGQSAIQLWSFAQ